MVVVGCSELKLEILGSDGHTHALGDIVVEFVNHGIDTSGLQFGIASIVALYQVFGLSTLDGAYKDFIGIMVIKQKDVVHATRVGE